MHFELPLTLVQFVIPPVCTGILIGGFLLYGYMALSYGSPLYRRLSILAFFALLFVGSEIFILGFGAFRHDWQLAVRFHQAEHLAGAFFVFALPYYLEQILTHGLLWKKINRMIWIAGLLFALACTISVVLGTDLFISSSIHKSTWLRFEADYGRGQEGILYMLRDLFLFMVIVYAGISIVMNMKNNRNMDYLLFPVIGMAIAVLGAAIDIGFVYTGVNFDFFPHTYFSRFSLGITAFILFLMSGVTRHFIWLSQELERTNISLVVSEEKYRVLVEGTNDMIFTLGPDHKFQSANRRMQRLLGMPEDMLRGKPFLDVVMCSMASKNVEKDLIREKIRDLETKRRPVTFKTCFVGCGLEDVREFEVRLEYLNIEGKNEIIGKASISADNAVVRYLNAESQDFTIGNHLVAAEEISKRLVTSLAKFMNQQDIVALRIGLREIIINAIEHGNLNISFDEKTVASSGEDYLEFIASRQKDPRYMDRTVTIRSSLNGKRVLFVIEDEGEGFDHEQILSRITKANDDALSHGRGLTMALGVFDFVRFNEKGNRVALGKKFCTESYPFEDEA